jgi:hypothetical protein
VSVGAQTDVVRKIKADVIRIFIDNDLVAVPEPIGDVIIVRRKNAEKEPAESESLPVASGKAPDMTPAEPSRKAPVFEGLST